MKSAVNLQTEVLSSVLFNPKVTQSLQHKACKISFEFFPPRTPTMSQTLKETLNTLGDFKPSFVSVTYGAGGSTRSSTLDTVLKIKQNTPFNVAAHLSCIGSSKQQIHALAQQYWNTGIKHIVAIRGDHEVTREQPQEYQPQEYMYAIDLVRELKSIADFHISVAAYPEVHPQAVSAQKDLDILKHKVDAGATQAITQFFFDNRYFFDFYDRAIQARINVPIVAGILPIQNITKTTEFARKCGTTIPSWLSETLFALQDDPDTQKMVAISYTVQQCLELYAYGIRHFHFYTLNRGSFTAAVCHILKGFMGR